jgi:hypothetical protein
MIQRDKANLIKGVVGKIILPVLLLYTAAGFSAERIGLVKTLEPSVSVVREGGEVNLEIGSKIFEADMIVTDSDGTVGITFNDGSMLTLGPGAKVVVDKYLFNLSEKKLSFLSKVLKGTVTFMSGAINKIAPGSIRFKTPTATLGLRGTKVIIEVD